MPRSEKPDLSFPYRHGSSSFPVAISYRVMSYLSPLYASGLLFSLAASLALFLDSPQKTMATYLLGATSVSSGHGGPQRHRSDPSPRDALASDL